MARAVYQYELSDPDFAWLLNSFREGHPEYACVDSAALPVILIRSDALPAGGLLEEAGYLPPPEEGLSESEFPFPLPGKK